MRAPEVCLWTACVALRGAFWFTATSCGAPKPTPAQEAQMVLIGACEARVLNLVEVAETREALCNSLKAVTPTDVCSGYIVKVIGRVCSK